MVDHVRLSSDCTVYVSILKLVSVRHRFSEANELIINFRIVFNSQRFVTNRLQVTERHSHAIGSVIRARDLCQI